MQILSQSELNLISGGLTCSINNNQYHVTTGIRDEEYFMLEIAPSIWINFFHGKAVLIADNSNTLLDSNNYNGQYFSSFTKNFADGMYHYTFSLR